MRFLVIGGGAREHAIGWKLSHSKLVSKLFFWPGNPIIRKLGTALDLSPQATLTSVADLAFDLRVDGVVVGPEAPLSDGLANFLKERNVPCFGPDKVAAQLETSKMFAKNIMREAGIPTANFVVAHGEKECRAVAQGKIRDRGVAVLKASGLANGKGVFICRRDTDLDEALYRLYQTMAAASHEVVVEDFLSGRECSYFCMLGKGKSGKIDLGFAVDYKRLKDGDSGPNTGGMGCYAPVPWLPADATQQVHEKIVDPLIAHLRSKNIEYVGFLYVGLMWTNQGPYVVEFNVRLGDPETQVLLSQDSRDLGSLIAGALELKPLELQLRSPNPLSNKVSVGVVMASADYPYGDIAHNEPAVVLPRELFSATPSSESAQVFAASLKENAEGQILTGKGRVLTVVASAKDFADARRIAYAKVSDIGSIWKSAQWRKDIANL